MFKLNGDICQTLNSYATYINIYEPGSTYLGSHRKKTKTLKKIQGINSTSHAV